MKFHHKALILSLLIPVAGIASESFDRIPQAISSRVPEVSDQLADTQGDVAVLIDINEHGYVTQARLKSASHAELGAACLQAIRDWRFEPAMKDGHAVAATFVQPFHFGERTLSTEDVTAKPAALRQVAPTLTDELENITGNVTLTVKLDEAGQVSHVVVAQSTHEELNAACAEAVKQWSFSPAIKQGKKVASTVYVPFRFIGRESLKPTATKAEVLADNHELRAIRQEMPSVPEALQDLGGDARIAFTVDEHGYVSGATVRSGSHPELAEVARKAVLKWKFKPVVRDGKPVAVSAVQPFNFGERSVAAEVVDKMPKPDHVVQPEIPEALRGVRGRVAVQFTIKESGEVAAVELKEASNPDMAKPIMDAARQWTFKPAVKGGKAVDSRVVVPFIVGAE